jgi:opacity protein-like surface antigen
MKRLVLPLLVALAVSTSLRAQQVSFSDSVDSLEPSPVAVATAAAPELSLVPALHLSFSEAPAVFSVPSAALPEAPAAPQTGYGGDIGYRWHLNAGYEYVHFSSAPFSANMSGIHTTLAYSLYDWFAFEGSVISAFGGDVFAPGETSKYVLLTGGAHITWNREPRRWSPWFHVLAGLARVNPQTAYNSKNGFAFQTGGGVDYAVSPRLSLRGQVDYVLSRLYAQTQNNVQAGVGFVLNF